jgi:hypothetical protein
MTNKIEPINDILGSKIFLANLVGKEIRKMREIGKKCAIKSF